MTPNNATRQCDCRLQPQSCHHGLCSYKPARPNQKIGKLGPLTSSIVSGHSHRGVMRFQKATFLLVGLGPSQVLPTSPDYNLHLSYQKLSMYSLFMTYMYPETNNHKGRQIYHTMK